MLTRMMQELDGGDEVTSRVRRFRIASTYFDRCIAESSGDHRIFMKTIKQELDRQASHITQRESERHPDVPRTPDVSQTPDVSTSHGQQMSLAQLERDVKQARAQVAGARARQRWAKTIRSIRLILCDERRKKFYTAAAAFHHEEEVNFVSRHGKATAKDVAALMDKRRILVERQAELKAQRSKRVLAHIRQSLQDQLTALEVELHTQQTQFDTQLRHYVSLTGQNEGIVREELDAQAHARLTREQRFTTCIESGRFVEAAHIALTATQSTGVFNPNTVWSLFAAARSGDTQSSLSDTDPLLIYCSKLIAARSGDWNVTIQCATFALQGLRYDVLQRWMLRGQLVASMDLVIMLVAHVAPTPRQQLIVNKIATALCIKLDAGNHGNADEQSGPLCMLLLARDAQLLGALRLGARAGLSVTAALNGVVDCLALLPRNTNGGGKVESENCVRHGATVGPPTSTILQLIAVLAVANSCQYTDLNQCETLLGPVRDTMQTAGLPQQQTLTVASAQNFIAQILCQYVIQCSSV
eukprot:m.392390 g.392390  ORF g.392390 m.392390 type:complete len:528 (-) comp21078_c2_seq36:1090-2673(-)